MEKQSSTEIEGKNREGWGRPTSGVKTFTSVVAFVQGGVGRYRQGWGREAKKIQMNIWHTYHRQR